MIFSLTPGIPVFRQQIPRTIKSTFTPAEAASYSAAITSWSQRELILAMIRAGRPSRAYFFSLSIRCRNLPLSHRGARESLFQARGSEYPESMLNTAVASSPMSSEQVRSPTSVYSFAVASL